MKSIGWMVYAALMLAAGASMTAEGPEGGSNNEMNVVYDPSKPNEILSQDRDDESNIYRPALESIRKAVACNY